MNSTCHPTVYSDLDSIASAQDLSCLRDVPHEASTHCHDQENNDGHVQLPSTYAQVGHNTTISTKASHDRRHGVTYNGEVYKRIRNPDIRAASTSSIRLASYRDRFPQSDVQGSQSTEETDNPVSKYTDLAKRLELDRGLPETQSWLNWTPLEDSSEAILNISAPKIPAKWTTKKVSLEERGVTSDCLLPDTQISPPNSVVPKPIPLSFDPSGPVTHYQSHSTVPTSADSSRSADSLLPDTQAGSCSQDPRLQFSSPETLSYLQSDNNLPDTQAPLPSQPPRFPSKGASRNISTPSQASTIEPNNLKPPLNKLSCRERKRFIVSPARPPILTKAMRLWISKTHSLLDPFRSDTDCWFHPSPPPPRLTANGILRPHGKIRRTFAWADMHGKHSLVLNYGICSKLEGHKMTKRQKDGWVQRQWHLSHLCGNWTCLNPDHATVEPGSINASRNNCFSHRDGCSHMPKCMKDLKAALGPDGKLVDHGGEGAERIRRAYHWDDWWGWGEKDGGDDVAVVREDYDEDSVLANVEGAENGETFSEFDSTVLNVPYIMTPFTLRGWKGRDFEEGQVCS